MKIYINQISEEHYISANALKISYAGELRKKFQILRGKKTTDIFTSITGDSLWTCTSSVNKTCS